MAVVPPAKVAVVVAGSVMVVVAGGVVVAAGGADEPADELSGSQPVFCKAKATSMTTANITRITMLTRKAIRRALLPVPLFPFQSAFAFRLPNHPASSFPSFPAVSRGFYTLDVSAGKKVYERKNFFPGDSMSALGKIITLRRKNLPMVSQSNGALPIVYHARTGCQGKKEISEGLQNLLAV